MGGDGEIAIDLRGLRREFGDLTGLPPVDAAVPAGQTLALFGPNGSGKSTLLRILAGLLRPTGGEARVLGLELPGDSWRLRGRIGYLGHRPLLYRDLTAIENLVFVADLNRLAGGRGRAEQLLAAIGATALADRRVAEMSAGEAQRVSICRSLLCDPEVLLLDEPETNLDAESREMASELLGRSRATKVIASHDRTRTGARAQMTLELG